MRSHESVSSDMATSTQVGRRPVGLLLEEHREQELLRYFSSARLGNDDKTNTLAVL